MHVADLALVLNSPDGSSGRFLPPTSRMPPGSVMLRALRISDEPTAGRRTPRAAPASTRGRSAREQAERVTFDDLRDALQRPRDRGRCSRRARGSCTVAGDGGQLRCAASAGSRIDDRRPDVGMELGRRAGARGRSAASVARMLVVGRVGDRASTPTKPGPSNDATSRGDRPSRRASAASSVALARRDAAGRRRRESRDDGRARRRAGAPAARTLRCAARALARAARARRRRRAGSRPSASAPRCRRSP